MCLRVLASSFHDDLVTGISFLYHLNNRANQKSALGLEFPWVDVSKQACHNNAQFCADVRDVLIQLLTGSKGKWIQSQNSTTNPRHKRSPLGGDAWQKIFKIRGKYRFKKTVFSGYSYTFCEPR